MTPQVPFIGNVTLAVTSTAQQYTDPNAAVPPAAGHGSASEPVQAAGMRIVPKLFQEIRFKAAATNSAVVKYGVRVGGVISYATLIAGESRDWSGSDIRNIPIDLTAFWFVGTAADVIEITGLPNRQ